jgi:hypothetical protein
MVRSRSQEVRRREYLLFRIPATRTMYKFLSIEQSSISQFYRAFLAVHPDYKQSKITNDDIVSKIKSSKFSDVLFDFM